MISSYRTLSPSSVIQACMTEHKYLGCLFYFWSWNFTELWRTAPPNGEHVVLQCLERIFVVWLSLNIPTSGSLTFFSSDRHQVGQTTGAPDHWRRLLLLILRAILEKKKQKQTSIIHTTCSLCCFLLVNLQLHVENLASSPDSCSSVGNSNMWFGSKVV